MTSSESIRAIVFVALAIAGCVIRTYIRNASGSKEDKALTPRASGVSGTVVDRPPYSTTSSGQVSQLVSVSHEQPARFATSHDTDNCFLEPAAHDPYGEQQYEDWAAMRLARGGCSDETESTIDSIFLQKSLANLDSFGISGESTPSIWTAHFPASQLRPY